MGNRTGFVKEYGKSGTVQLVKCNLNWEKIMIFALIFIEGLAASFTLLLGCVVGIAKKNVNLVCFYEKPVWDRVIEKELITKKQIIKNANLFKLFSVLPLLVVTLFCVYYINGARGFLEGFWQITAILIISGLFDRFFIDTYWVGHTNAWIIPGTEDLMPYIHKNTMIKKWLLTLVGFPLISAILSAVMMIFIR